MSLPLLEPFTGSAGVLPDPPWTQMSTVTSLTYDGSGAGVSNTSGEGAAWDNSNTYNNDQYAQAKIQSPGGFGSGRTANVYVRASGVDGTKKGYVFYSDGSSGAAHTELAIVWNNASTILRNFATTFVAGDLLRIEASGTVITCYKNGVSLGTYDTSGDTNKIASGAAGVGTTNNTTTVDDWEGGNLGVATSVPGDEGGYMPMAAPALGPNLLYY